ncbi:ROK family protein [Niabella hibiscisoli]|uniref:ROK family protein n=1 Tax=Niabella hibiscisoli TaxID=1825928 RepID=UPI001F0FBE9B|nr:ROK family protein [Niabella hibiscisoli]MCH5718066.1 ROK family protein [Niabella hibiscisoli]
MKTWGIDLGGTKIECAVLDAETLSVVERQRIPTEAGKGYGHILSQISKLIGQVAQNVGEMPARIGLATPGVLQPETQTMKNCNTTCMNGRRMLEDLEELLKIPVRLANDANCFALAEALMGAGKDFPGAEVVWGIIMGTGVGGGLVVNQKIINGHHGIGGEWGHNILEDGGELCYCNKQGCVETVISGPALERAYEKLTGTALKLNEIIDRHLASSDVHASEVVERLLENYGKALSSVINIIDPSLIVIGGGVGNIDLLYTEGYERIKNIFLTTGNSPPQYANLFWGIAQEYLEQPYFGTKYSINNR